MKKVSVVIPMYYEEEVARECYQRTKKVLEELQDYDYDNKQIVLEKEKENIIKHINSRDYVITMQIEGKNISSEDFADKIDKVFVTNPNIAFIIGGSYGLHDDIKKISNFSLSFSKMTFPHQLFRVLLLEQIYRAYKIINNESYHK